MVTRELGRGAFGIVVVARDSRGIFFDKKFAKAKIRFHFSETFFEHRHHVCDERFLSGSF